MVFDESLIGSCLLSKLSLPSTYSFYGSFNASALGESGAKFLADRSDGNRDSLAAAFSRFLSMAHADCLATSDLADVPSVGTACWFTIRAFGPTDEYVQPRWHRDGRMFQCTCNADPAMPHSKYAVTILGPATRVLGSSAYVNEVMGMDCAWENRSILADKLAGCNLLVVESGQVIRFSWGQDDSPVHSEPDFSGEDRVFVSVLFGSKREIRDMCSIRDEIYGKAEF